MGFYRYRRHWPALLFSPSRPVVALAYSSACLVDALVRHQSLLLIPNPRLLSEPGVRSLPWRGLPQLYGTAGMGVENAKSRATSWARRLECPVDANANYRNTVWCNRDLIPIPEDRRTWTWQGFAGYWVICGQVRREKVSTCGPRLTNPLPLSASTQRLGRLGPLSCRSG